MSTQPLATNISLRPVGPEDDDFLLAVYASTRADEMALVPWSDQQREAFIRSQLSAQLDHYSKKYPAANHDVILSNGRQVGRLYVARLDHEIRIVDITLLPADRNVGIGSYLIERLLDEARRGGKVTRIYVEEFNPSLSLFRRFGFSLKEQHGIHLLLESAS